ncbi:type II and III secretion system protein family protein [soil metagenome]
MMVFSSASFWAALRQGSAAACIGLMTIGTVLPASASAQTYAGGGYDGGARSSVAMGTAPRMVNLPRGSSFAVDLPADVHDVIVSDPRVAESLVHNPRRVTVIGVAPGETDAIFLDAGGRTILALKIRVDAGVSALQDTIGRIAPGSQAHAEAVNDSIVLTGLVTSPGEADRIVQVARAFVSAPEKVLNMMTVAGSDQVTLKVRVVEIQRNAIKQLGFNTSAVLGQVGDAQFLLGQIATFGVNAGLQGGISAGYFNDTTVQPTLQQPCGAGFVVGTLCPNVIHGPADASNYDSATPANTVGSDGLNKGEATIKAFERVGLIRTLAEPNLTSVNGESASFLAGGEFPVPTGRDTQGNISVEYKPYGVSLAFRPVVQSGGNISMQINIEVSELTNTGGLVVGAGTASSITLPGISVRRSQTTVEMPSGGSMMIAGLLQESTKQNIDALPGLMNVPVLGSLFRSRDYLSGETELVVIVEPYIVRPTAPGQMQTPADGLRIATDIQTTLFGQLNQAYGTPPPTATAGVGWAGPVGYVIE